MELNFRARLTWCAHLFKACTKQHHQELEPVLSGLIGKDSIVLDVGGHAGQFTKLFARLAPNGRVYVFEPGSYALSILRKAIAFNRLRNVTILPCGLGDRPGRLSLSVPVKPSGSIGFGLSHLGTADPEGADEPPSGGAHVDEPVELTTIDDFVAMEHIERIDFIKADTEGWELRMLVGARRSLARFCPSMMIEVDSQHLTRARDSAEELYGFLAGFGYRAFKLDPRSMRLDELPHPQDGDIFFVAPAQADKWRVRDRTR